MLAFQPDAAPTGGVTTLAQRPGSTLVPNQQNNGTSPSVGPKAPTYLQYSSPLATDKPTGVQPAPVQPKPVLSQPSTNGTGVGGSAPAQSPTQRTQPQVFYSPPVQVPSGLRPGATPPANPNANIAPVVQGNGQDISTNLGNDINNQLQNPSRFDLPQVQQAYNFFKQDLQDQARLAGSNAIADANARGVYYGSPLTTSLGDINTQLQRGLGALATNIGLEQAQTQGQDLNSAIQNGMNFGQLGMVGQNQNFNQALQTALLGEQGAPTMTGYGGALGGFSPALNMMGNYNPSMYQNLGSMLAGQ